MFFDVHGKQVDLTHVRQTIVQEAKVGCDKLNQLLVNLGQFQHEQDDAMKSPHHVNHVLPGGTWNRLVMLVVLDVLILGCLAEGSRKWRLVDQILNEFEEILMVDLDLFVEYSVVV